MSSRIQFLIDKYETKKISDIFDIKNIEKKNYTDEKFYDWRYSSNPNKCFFHKKLMRNLKIICENNDIPHIIFYGCPGTGKKTVIKLFLEMIFGSDVRDTNDVEYEIAGSSKKNKKKIIKQSEHHIIIEPNSNNFDKYLIQYIVKEYAKSKPLCIYDKNTNFKVVQINSLDNLSYYAQTSLRRTIEKYSKTCKFIMWCNSLSKIIEPLKSRCLCIHIPNQSTDDLYDWLLNISLLENIKLSHNSIENIIHSSNGNLREILWKTDLFKYCNKINHSCDTLIDDIVIKIFKKDNIQNIKNNIYKIYVTNLHSIDIINKIIAIVLKKINSNDIEKALQIVQIASKYEHRILHCRRDTIHIEAFITNLINIL